MKDREARHFEGYRGRGGGRGRMERGALRWILLDSLREGPRHGYEIMKSIEQRTSGEYVPSPGTIYPTLQLLEDEGLIRAEQQADRRVYQLSEAGRAEVEKENGRIQCFWKKFTAPQPPDAVRQELEFLHDEIDSLHRTIWGSLRESIESGDRAAIRRMRQLIQRHHEEIRDFIVNTNSDAEVK